MNLLAIDTSSQRSIIGLQLGRERLARVTLSGQSHSRDILPSIVSLLEEGETDLQALDAIVFGQGPGSFTGLRIAAGVVQGLGYGLDIPVVSVSTMACMARGQFRQTGSKNILVAQSARKEEVYLGAYSIDSVIPRLHGQEMVVEASELNLPELETVSGPWSGAGSGWQLRAQLEKALGITMERVELDIFPEPDDLLDIGMAKMEKGETISALAATPEYLREQVATVPGG